MVEAKSQKVFWGSSYVRRSYREKLAGGRFASNPE